MEMMKQDVKQKWCQPSVMKARWIPKHLFFFVIRLFLPCILRADVLQRQ